MFDAAETYLVSSRLTCILASCCKPAARKKVLIPYKQVSAEHDLHIYVFSRLRYDHVSAAKGVTDSQRIFRDNIAANQVQPNYYYRSRVRHAVKLPRSLFRKV